MKKNPAKRPGFLFSWRISMSKKRRCIGCGTEIGLKYYKEAGIYICHYCEKDRSEQKIPDEKSWVASEISYI